MWCLKGQMLKLKFRNEFTVCRYGSPLFAIYHHGKHETWKLWQLAKSAKLEHRIHNLVSVQFRTTIYLYKLVVRMNIDGATSINSLRYITFYAKVMLFCYTTNILPISYIGYSQYRVVLSVGFCEKSVVIVFVFSDLTLINGQPLIIIPPI